jgi:DNA-binding XRE family transcriptional regulator
MAVRFTTPEKFPGKTSPEGARAAWWRERVMEMSRPELALHLDITDQTIAAYEAMDKVPVMYRLACSAFAKVFRFDWRSKGKHWRHRR